MFKEKVRRTASFAILAILLLGTLIFAGCGTDENSGQADANPNAALSGTINIAGSTSVQPFSEVLAEEFMKLHKDVQINGTDPINYYIAYDEHQYSHNH
jgi:phosphate transport system substrate-binding protein